MRNTKQYFETKTSDFKQKIILIYMYMKLDKRRDSYIKMSQSWVT